MDKLIFSFYGFGIEIVSSDLQTIHNVKRDYSFFIQKKAETSVKIEIIPLAPDYVDLPFIPASVYTPRNICYNHNHLAYIDYYGRGLVIIDKKKREYKVYSKDQHLRHEIVYLTILSLVGKYLDSKGLHRVHGFGIDIRGKGVLVLLPRGGGKTTLLLDLLKSKDIKLISEDSPLIDRAGRILPFPIRIGVSAKDTLADIPQEYVHLLERMEFGPKYLIDIEAFKEKISRDSSSPWLVIVGTRGLGPGSEIKPLSKFKVLGEFIKNSVIGLGLYQGIEFILQKNIFELFNKSGILISRLINSYKIIRASDTYSFILGSDKKRNFETLSNFLDSLSG